MNRNTRALAAFGMALAVLSATLGAAVVPAPASAQTGENSVVDGLFHDEDETEDVGGWVALKAGIMGLVDKWSPLTDRPDQTNATGYCSRLETTFNQNSGALTNWTNARATADTDADVVRIKCQDEDGGDAWLFVTADVNSTTGNYSNATAMNLSEFKDTNREADMTFTLSPYASRNADKELETFVSDYAKPGKNVDQAYLAHLAGEYRGEVSGDDLPGDD